MDQAKLRVKNRQSILCADYNSARNIAIKYTDNYLEINRGTYGEEGYYPHFHIDDEHGDPHIWFFPAT